MSGIKTLRYVTAAGLLALALAAPAILPVFTLQLLIRGLYLGMIAMTFVLLGGFGDMISLAQMSFAAVAGYVVAIGTTKYALSHGAAAVLAVIAAALLAAVFGVIAIRGRKVYFLMMTLALGQLFYGVGMQWASVTGGSYGYTGLTRPEIFGHSLVEAPALYYVTLIAALLSYLGLRRIVHSNFGLALRGVRDNPKRMAALGFNVQRHRYVAIVISGAFAGVAGLLNTYFTGVISPSRAGLSQSVLVVMAGLLGGLDRLEGGLLGGVVMAFLLSIASDFTERYWTVIGVLFILVVRFLPGGLLGGAPRLVASVIGVARPAGSGSIVRTSTNEKRSAR